MADIFIFIFTAFFALEVRGLPEIKLKIKLPIDTISINCSKSKMSAITAAIAPDINVAFNGVFVRPFTRLNTENINPSDDIAYKIRGNGNIPPNKLVQSAKTAPTETILFQNLKN